MPDGHVQRIDNKKEQITVVRNGRRYLASTNEVGSNARVVGARVHFDIGHRDGVDRAENVQLASGTRTNKRQRRFGDLTGAKRPAAKVKSTSATRLNIDVTTQPLKVVAALVESLRSSSFDDATSLYAPEAVLHTGSNTLTGRKSIRAALEDIVSTTVGSETDIHGVDQLVVMSSSEDGGPETESWFEVDRGAIIEHWHGIAPEFGKHDADDAIDADVSIIRTGAVDASQEQRLRDDVARLVTRSHIPVEQVRIKIDEPSTPSHPYSVSATVHAGNTHVRSHITAPTFEEAIDTVCLRLRRQLDRSADRRRRTPDQHRPDDHSWRHGDRPAVAGLAAFGPEPSQREVVRHKSWGPERSSIDEAVWDMEQADYDFYLFVEESTAEPAIVFRSPNGVKCQLASGGNPLTMPNFAAIEHRAAPTHSPNSAMTVLNAGVAPFVFAISHDEMAFVMYRRLDGHYGLIEPLAATLISSR